MKFGERIRTARKNKNLTQDEVARHLHVSRKTISHWENEQSYPDIDSLINISNYFKISLDSMLKEDHQMKKALDSNEVLREIQPITKLINEINLACLIVMIMGIFIGAFAKLTFVCFLILLADYAVLNRVNDLRTKVGDPDIEKDRQQRLKKIKFLIPITIILAIGTFLVVYFHFGQGTYISTFAQEARHDPLISLFLNHSFDILMVLTIFSGIRTIINIFHYKYDYLSFNK